MSHYDLNNPRDLLEVQVKLRGSLDERMVIAWIRATQYAVVDTKLTPMYNLLNASFQKFSRVADDTFAIRMLELAYFTDLSTGEAAFEFVNPFNGKGDEFPPAMFGPNFVSLNTEGLQPPENFPFGTLTFDGQLGPGFTDGEDVWVREDTLVQMQSNNPGFGDYIYNELVNYRGNWAQVNDPDIQSVPSMVSYNTTSNWRPYMMADDIGGHIMTNGYGRKVASIDELPADYLALARKHDPEVLANAEDILDNPPQFPLG